MDHRYLRDADKLDLKIPTLRRLMNEGAVAVTPLSLDMTSRPDFPLILRALGLA